MSSYEKQMQWRKAAIVKTKKMQEDKAAEQSHSFTPVFYTQNSSGGLKDTGERHSKLTTDGRSGRPHQSANRIHVESSSHRQRESDENMHSPTGASSIGSNAPSHYSESSAHYEGGYGSSYAEQHANHHSSNHYHNKNYVDHHREYIAQEDDVSLPSVSVGKGSPLLSRKEREHNSHHGHRSSSRQGSYSKKHGNKHRGNRQSSTRHHHSRDRSRSVSSRRSHSSCTSSGSGRSRGQEVSSGEDDEADEPIIELLERERRQWREEREQLIQCIHLQQLELSQRSVAAHERAADIAKEFARAIECFEERLVSVEGTVQKEIMSIKSIAESLLHAATISSSAAPAGASNSTLARPIV